MNMFQVLIIIHKWPKDKLSNNTKVDKNTNSVAHPRTIRESRNLVNLILIKMANCTSNRARSRKPILTYHFNLVIQLIAVLLDRKEEVLEIHKLEISLTGTLFLKWPAYYLGKKSKRGSKWKVEQIANQD